MMSESSIRREAFPANPPFLFWAPLLLVLAAAAVYANSLRIPFVLDDEISIEENESIRHLWPPWPVLHPQAGHTISRPFLSLTLALNYAFGGLDVRGYHLFNLAVHTLAALALFGAARRALLKIRGAPFSQRESSLLAFGIALIWVLHPLQVVSVSYIVQRAESMMGLFYLLILYCLLREAESPKQLRWRILAWTSMLLGAGSKEVIVTAPVVALLYDRIFLASSMAEILRKRKWFHAGLAAGWLPLVWLIWSGGGRGGAVGFGCGVEVSHYVLTQMKAVVMYLRLSFWPSPLVFDYGKALVEHPSEVRGEALILTLMAAGTLYALWRRPAAGFCAASFFIILSPSSSFVPLTTQTMGEHRMYLPLACLAALLAPGFYLTWRHFVRPLAPDKTWVKLFPLAVLALSAALLGESTRRRNARYQTELAIWDDTAVKRPKNVRTFINRGRAHEEREEWEKALENYTRAAHLRPDYAKARYNRANALHRLGRFEEALREANRAIALRKDYAKALYLRGLLHSRRHAPHKALEDYTAAVAARPDYVKAWNNRGNILKQLDRPAEALDCYNKALALDPGYLRALYNRAALRRHSGDYQGAEEDYTSCLTINPQFEEALYNRATLFLTQGRLPEALDDYNRLIHLAPAHVKAYNNRAGIHKQLEEYEKALADCRRAAELRPDNPRYLAHYAWALAAFPAEGLRDGPRALGLARRACELDGRSHSSLKALAAAYAECGQFEKAAAAAQEALRKAEAAKAPSAAARLRQCLERCRAGLPCRE